MTLSPLAFLNPFILLALIGLPLLWYLLRVTPPAPQKIIFPALKFLKNLEQEKTTSQKTPWWILLLRSLMIGFLIVALAKPVLNPTTSLQSDMDMRLVIDNGWAAGQTWDEQIAAAENLIAQAQRAQKNIYIQTTAAEPQSTLTKTEGPLTAADARAIIRGLSPYPWPVNYKALSETLPTLSEAVHTYWLGHGLNEGGFKTLATRLNQDGALTYYKPESNNAPLFIKPSGNGADLPFTVQRVGDASSNQSININVLSESRTIIHYETTTLSAPSQDVTLNMDDDVRNAAARIDIASRKSAGSSVLLDDRYKKRSVGIVTHDGSENTKPLIDAAYYLTRALEPYTSLSQGSIENLIDQNPSVIIMPDIGALTPDTLTSLENWVKDGGLLLRFAGPKMAAASDHFLTPVPVLKGARALQGDITWDTPLALTPFPESSPFYGLGVPDGLQVRQQILTAPIDENNDEQSVWANLEDGTPLITAASLEKGRLVLVHTTATPDWSDLAISGLYLDILQKIVNLSGTKSSASVNSKMLDPVRVMNGFGELITPQSVKPIEADRLDTLLPSSMHPPGLYGSNGNLIAFNLGERLQEDLKAAPSLPLGANEKTYNKNFETDLTAFFLSAALALLLIDWIVMMALASGFSLPRRAFTTAAIFILCLAPLKAYSSDIQYAGDIYMAYMASGNAAVDNTTENGLNALADILRRRTSVEPRGTVKLNPETDTLSFFPLIFWPVAENAKPLSETAIKNVQSYLDQGGTILFDTRDQNISVNGAATTPNAIALQNMVGQLNVPALTPASKDHVLRRSFYLIDGFPGRYSGGALWVEQQSIGGRDGVSSILVGGHDWASAWGANLSGGSLRPHLSGGPKQQEMSYRFGVNLMMYALTGNYKADQVHLPHILERLDQ